MSLENEDYGVHSPEGEKPSIELQQQQTLVVVDTSPLFSSHEVSILLASCNVGA